MNILMLSTTFIPSILLCGHCQLDYLEKQGLINYKFVPSHFVNQKNVEWADVIVFGRSDTDIDAFVAKVAKKAGKHLVYFLDDDILNVPNYLSSSPYYLLPSTQKNIRKTMSYCDTFLTPSPVLLEKYGKNFNHKFLISEPSLNRIYKKEKNNKIKIGFAGSIDRAQDINEILEEAVRELIKKYGDKIEFEFMGARPDFIDELGLTYLPYQDGYDAYTAFMARCNWDIGLAPMPKTDFHRCKYFNKYVEYASFGIVGVYSNCEPYVFGIKNRENGLLVDNNTEDWVNAISELIDNNDLRKQMSNYCLKEADEKYSLKVLAPDYYQKLINDFNKKEKYGNIPTFVFAKTSFFFKRVYRKIKEKGKDFPEWLSEKIDKKIKEQKEKKENKQNLRLIEEIIRSRKTVFIIAPLLLNEDSESEYEKRIKLIDDLLKEKYYLIYLNGEDRSLEYIKTDFVDKNHGNMIFNSFDTNQTDKIIELIKKSGTCIIHSVIRFIREKLSSDMYRVFDLDDVTTIWDSHGNIPEEFHALSNIHSEMVTNEIEKIFYEKADYVLYDNWNSVEHIINKYDKSNIKTLMISNIQDGNKLIGSIEKND